MIFREGDTRRDRGFGPEPEGTAETPAGAPGERCARAVNPGADASGPCAGGSGDSVEGARDIDAPITDGVGG